MSNIFMLLIAVTIMFFTEIPSCSAQDAHSHDDEQQINKPIDTNNIEVKKDEIVVVVHGIVCSFCSQGVTRKLSKLSFIDNSKYTKGVKVEIEKQRVTISIKPDSNFDIIEVFKSIISGGYEPVVAYQNVDNEIVTIHPERL